MTVFSSSLLPDAKVVSLVTIFFLSFGFVCSLLLYVVFLYFYISLLVCIYQLILQYQELEQ